MEIKDFVATTLTQICQGVVEAQKSTKSLGACVSPRTSCGMLADSWSKHSSMQTVSFDIAVEVVNTSEETKGKPKFSIEIASVTASLGDGSKKEQANSNRDALRVHFDIPVCWPVDQFVDSQYQEPATPQKNHDYNPSAW